MARPSTYSEEIANRVLGELMTGKTLREVCRGEGLPDESTVRGWVKDDREGFTDRYTQAREIGYFAMFDEILEIADDGTNDWVERKRGDSDETETVFDHEHVQRSKLRVEARKYMLSKALPKIFGEKITQELTGADGAPLTAVINVTRGNKPPSSSKAG